MVLNILNTIDTIAPDARAILEQLGTVHDFSPEAGQQAFEVKVKSCDIVFLGLGLTVSRNSIDNAQQLKIIATATTGLDHIDVDYATSRGIEVLSLRGEDEFLNTITGTAELAWGLLVSLVRFIPWAHEDVKKYHWNREAFRGHNLYGKTLGIVGLGRLGRWMARYAEAFGMKIIFYDPNIGQNFFVRYTKVSFEELLEMSDAISIHAHLTSETENLFSEKVFLQMKKGSYLINTARGKVVDENALLKALENGHLGGYGTDVLADELYFEKGFNDHPLVAYAKNHRNLVIVPHIGGMTVESRKRTDIFMAQKIKRFLKK